MRRERGQYLGTLTNVDCRPPIECRVSVHEPTLSRMHSGSVQPTPCVCRLLRQRRQYTLFTVLHCIRQCWNVVESTVASNAAPGALKDGLKESPLCSRGARKLAARKRRQGAMEVVEQEPLMHGCASRSHPHRRALVGASALTARGLNTAVLRGWAQRRRGRLQRGEGTRRDGGGGVAPRPGERFTLPSARAACPPGRGGLRALLPALRAGVLLPSVRAIRLAVRWP